MRHDKRARQLFFTILIGGIVCLQAWANPIVESPKLAKNEPVKIGMVSALNGPAAALGTNVTRGFKLYIDHINARGGVNGRPLELVSYDDGYEPAQTIMKTRKLLEDDKVFLLAGYVGTPTSRVAVPIAMRAKVPYVAPFTGATFLRDEIYDYVVNVRASYADETAMMVGFLKKQGVKRVGIFMQNDAYGDAGLVGVQSAIKNNDMQLVGKGNYKRNTTDIDAALSALVKAKPEAVIMIGTYAPSAAFIKKAKAIGFAPIFISISFVGTSPLLEALGKDGEGVFITQVMPSPMFSDLPIVAEYRKLMNKQGGQLDYGSLEGFVDAAALVYLIETADRKTDGALTRDDVMRAARDSGKVDIMGLPMDFSAKRNQAMDKVYLTQIRQGKVMPVELDD